MEKPPGTFTSDGCTFFPDVWDGADLRPICVEHDYAYWIGGTEEERLAADINMHNRIITEHDLHLIASIMFRGVRFGGGRHWPLSPMPKQHHWGYGWPKAKYGRAYGEVQGELV